MTQVFSFKTDISTLKEPILDLLEGLRGVGDTINGFETLEVSLPVIDAPINELLADDPNVGLSDFFDFYTPALEYFTLLQVFNFDIDAHLPTIGALPGIDLPNLDVNMDAHRLKLKNLIEKEYDLSHVAKQMASLYESVNG